MTQAVFWPGSGSNPSGSTALGIFDSETAFQNDAPKIASWICTSLGYPVMAVELSDAMIYTQIESAILEYSSQVNEFNLRDNMLALQGLSTGSNITQRLVKGTALPYIIEISDQYGTEAGAGGNVSWKKGGVTMSANVQEYDLQQLWASGTEGGNRIEIRRIFHDRSPAISRGGFGFGDVGIGPTDGTNNLLGEFGWAGFDGGMNSMAGAGSTGQMLVMPIYETLLRTQAIEFNDIVRRSQYSFELINNKLRIFPRPTESGEILWFQYLVKKDRFDSVLGNGGVISDFSNAPYNNMLYSKINDIGKQWIRKFALALCKGMLGRILSKYESLPIPNSEVRMDGPQLRQESTQEKEMLYTQLRESLEESGRAKQMEKMASNEEKSQEILNRAPLKIYIG